MMPEVVEIRFAYLDRLTAFARSQDVNDVGLNSHYFPLFANACSYTLIAFAATLGA